MHRGKKFKNYVVSENYLDTCNIRNTMPATLLPKVPNTFLSEKHLILMSKATMFTNEIMYTVRNSFTLTFSLFFEKYEFLRKMYNI